MLHIANRMVRLQMTIAKWIVAVAIPNVVILGASIPSAAFAPLFQDSIRFESKDLQSCHEQLSNINSSTIPTCEEPALLEQLQAKNSQDPAYLLQLLRLALARAETQYLQVDLPQKLSGEMESLKKLSELIIQSLQNYSFLEKDVALEQLRWFALVGRYDDSITFIQNSKLLSFRYFREKVISHLVRWDRAREIPAYRAYLKQHFRDRVSKELSQFSDEEFENWYEFIRVSPAPSTPQEITEFLQSLRNLAIVFPLPDKTQRLRSLANQKGLGSQYRPPLLRDLSLSELLLQAESLIKAIRTEDARLVLERALQIPGPVDQEQLWKAFDLHVRVLRLLDRRHQIEQLIERYLKKGKFLEESGPNTDIKVLLSRAYDVARFRWTYVGHTRALETIDQIIRINNKFNTNHFLSSSLYIRARIMEQTESPEVAVVTVNEALKSVTGTHRIELLWRKVFLLTEVGEKSKNFESAISTLKQIRPVLREPSEVSQWNYWMGFLARLSSRPKDANRFFLNAYHTDPYSFYANIAALELIRAKQSVPQWNRSASSIWKEPTTELKVEWKNFFDPSDHIVRAGFSELARAYYLLKAGDIAASQDALTQFRGDYWRFVQGRKNSTSVKRELVKAMARLEFETKNSFGMINAIEAARTQFGYDLTSEELALFYPLPFREVIFKTAQEKQLNPWFAISLIRQESAFNADALSSANALGLMQMIPSTAEVEARKAKFTSFQFENLKTPEISIQLGVQHLKGLEDNFEGSWIAATAAYNAGTPPVDNWLQGFGQGDPRMFIERISYAETRKYVKSILRNFINYQRLYGDPSKIEFEDLLKLPQRLPGRPLNSDGGGS